MKTIIFLLFILSGYVYSVPSTIGNDSVAIIPPKEVNNETIPKYDRKYFKHWTDGDNDCQGTRTEVLIRDSMDDKVMYNDDKECTAIFAIVYDYYTGKILPSYLVDIDHFVPLKNAWMSGAWKWTPEKREQYANDLKDRWHLTSVSSDVNRSKSWKSPDEWMPPDFSFHIFYCVKWLDIKVKWDLTATQKEVDFIKEVLKDFDKNRKTPRVYPKIRN